MVKLPDASLELLDYFDIQTIERCTIKEKKSKEKKIKIKIKLTRAAIIAHLRYL